ncbi:unnamed protein product [Rotaria socialis]|uniref:Protein SYS1 homolog n=1 Tax=Rotaria socialis TaxID=392032 RepID=A0A820AK58_9BILA|nr:unnamed protein product [Rotaria socialis]CAF4615327.1 unnamed protein product [Rotaria socialis]CAF4702668.1 unnamed protein product [Rotaria socialis]CAF4865336.1 unnamed protein product [Rotaria socialis]
MTGFRNQKWDPWLIISQIIAVQAIYYFGFGLWILLITITFNRVPSLDYFFSYDTLQLSSWNGRFFSTVFLLNTFTGALAIFYLVGRYKQCLDFSITIHFYHFIACCIYNYQYPNIFSWYVVQFLSIVIMTILSERFSKKYELQNISLTSRADL